MKCRDCHIELKGHARFCSECGAPVPLEPPTTSKAISLGAVGTRDQSKQSDLIYPPKTPLSPHLCWLNLLLAGLAQIIYGQVGKGLTILGAVIISNFIIPVLPALSIVILSIVDAYQVGAYLKQGKPVGKWQIFPGA
jgi:TM2 domain-containing membrane protein YozV